MVSIFDDLGNTLFIVALPWWKTCAHKDRIKVCSRGKGIHHWSPQALSQIFTSVSHRKWKVLWYISSASRTTSRTNHPSQCLRLWFRLKGANHECVYFPKFHCELIFLIENSVAMNYSSTGADVNTDIAKPTKKHSKTRKMRLLRMPSPKLFVDSSIVPLSWVLIG